MSPIKTRAQRRAEANAAGHMESQGAQDRTGSLEMQQVRDLENIEGNTQLSKEMPDGSRTNATNLHPLPTAAPSGATCSGLPGVPPWTTPYWTYPGLSSFHNCQPPTSTTLLPMAPHWGMDITTATALTTSKDAKDLVPPFDPTNARIEIWITKVEELAAIYNWNDRTKAHFALSKLSGIAATWYQGLQSINFTWPEWKSLLQTNFPTRRNFYDEIKEIIDTPKMLEESYFAYVHRKLAQINDLGIGLTDAVKQDLVLGGVEPAVRVTVQGHGTLPSAELAMHLKSFESCGAPIDSPWLASALPRNVELY